MKNLISCKDFYIGDTVVNITSGSICETYPLTDFKNYISQTRNNNIRVGKVIDMTPEHVLLKTLLIENNNEVCCVRVYE